VAESEGNIVQDEGERVESADAVGMVEEEIGAGEEGAERGRRSCRITSVGESVD
jgi:hypothetical protein